MTDTQVSWRSACRRWRFLADGTSDVLLPSAARVAPLPMDTPGLAASAAPGVAHRSQDGTLFGSPVVADSHRVERHVMTRHGF